MNNLKNKNLNSIKKTVIFKTKSKTKIKPSHHIYSKENKKNSSKKCYKSSTNITNGIVTNAKINSNNIKQADNNNLPLDETDKTKMNEESNNNSYKNINDKDLLYQTVENNHFNGDIINNNFNFLNIINTSNKRNNDSQKEGLTTIKTLNTMKSYQQSVNVSNNMNLENHNNIINNNINIIENNIIQNIESKNDIAFQTYNGSFRQNIIKVNILDKAKITITTMTTRHNIITEEFIIILKPVILHLRVCSKGYAIIKNGNIIKIMFRRKMLSTRYKAKQKRAMVNAANKTRPTTVDNNEAICNKWCAKVYPILNLSLTEQTKHSIIFSGVSGIPAFSSNLMS
jgi:hypothetical protein